MTLVIREASGVPEVVQSSLLNVDQAYVVALNGQTLPEQTEARAAVVAAVSRLGVGEVAGRQPKLPDASIVADALKYGNLTLVGLQAAAEWCDRGHDQIARLAGGYVGGYTSEDVALRLWATLLRNLSGRTVPDEVIVRLGLKVFDDYRKTLGQRNRAAVPDYRFSSLYRVVAEGEVALRAIVAARNQGASVGERAEHYQAQRADMIRHAAAQIR